MPTASGLERHARYAKITGMRQDLPSLALRKALRFHCRQDSPGQPSKPSEELRQVRLRQCAECQGELGLPCR